MIAAGRLARPRGDLRGAVKWLNAGLKLYRALGEESGIAQALQQLGFTVLWQGEHEKAIALLQQGLELARAARDRIQIGGILLMLGDAQMQNSDLDAADTHFQEALQIHRELGERVSLSWTLGGLGDIARLQGKYELAFARFKEALRVKSEMDTTGDIAFLFEALANLMAETGQPTRAARLWGVGEEVRAARNEPVAPSYARVYAPHIGAVRQELGSERFAAEWERGRALTMPQALAYALVQDEIAAPIVKGMVEPLSPREMQVLQLIAEGNSNEAIAEKLVLARGTVKWYTTQLYGKLGVTSRTQAVVRARQLELLPSKPDT